MKVTNITAMSYFGTADGLYVRETVGASAEDTSSLEQDLLHRHQLSQECQLRLNAARFGGSSQDYQSLDCDRLIIKRVEVILRNGKKKSNLVARWRRRAAVDRFLNAFRVFGLVYSIGFSRYFGKFLDAETQAPRDSVSPSPAPRSPCLQCVQRCRRGTHSDRLEGARHHRHGRLKRTLRFPVVIEGWNFYKPEEALDHGFVCVKTGRPSVNPPQQHKPRQMVM
jgi:hypothetical protein